jgi:hypothetical protein
MYILAYLAAYDVLGSNSFIVSFAHAIQMRFITVELYVLCR